MTLAATAFVTAGAGFLLAVLWFDLMFDVQVLAHRRASVELPEPVLESIAAYYARVTTAATPMNRLVMAAMAGTVAALALQIGHETPTWVSVASLALALAPIALALARTVPSAVRLGLQADDARMQSRLARSICRDHLLSAASIATLLAVQLAFAT